MNYGGEKGFALIAVLWTLALLSIIAAVLSLETRTSLRLSRNAAEIAAAHAAADAGVQLAILNLLADRARFRPDGTVYAWQFVSSTVRISIQEFGTSRALPIIKRRCRNQYAETVHELHREDRGACALLDRVQNVDDLRRLATTSRNRNREAKFACPARWA